MGCAAGIQQTSFPPGPSVTGGRGAAWLPGRPLQSKIQDAILQIWMKEMPETAHIKTFIEAQNHEI